MTDRNLTCNQLDEQLGEYFEGTLDDSAVADIELHLSGCAECSALVRDFERIANETSALPARAPSHDLWPGIVARLDTPVVSIASRERKGSGLWRRARTASLAAGLVGITALVTYSITTRDTVRQTAVAPSDVADSANRSVVASATLATAPVPSDATVDAVLSPSSAPVRSASAPAETPVGGNAVPARATYDAEIAALRTMFTQRGETLDPRTKAVLESSLATIDSAVAEARRALAADPASRFLTEQLTKALEQKLGLLRTAALLPSHT
ncbi:MAG: zf-HC2 domain-containing protein [Gemmatimonadaceae bacterium]